MVRANGGFLPFASTPPRPVWRLARQGFSGVTPRDRKGNGTISIIRAVKAPVTAAAMTAMMWEDGTIAFGRLDSGPGTRLDPNRLCNRHAEHRETPSRGSEEGAIRMIRVDTR